MTAPSVLNGNEEQTTPLLSPELECWRALIEVCQERNIAPEIIVQYDVHRDHQSATERAYVIRDLHVKKHLSAKVISKMSGLAETRVYRILGGDLAAKRQPESDVNAVNGSRTDGV